MFGKKKKEREAKLLAEQQSLLEPEEDVLDAEIIPDEDVEIINDEDASVDNNVEEISLDDVVEETPVEEKAAEDDFFIDEATFSSAEANEEEITFDDVDDFNAKADIDIEALNSQIQLDEEEKAAVAKEEALVEEELLPEEVAEDQEEIDEESAIDSESADETVEENKEEAKQEEEVVYVVDGPEEDDEIVKPARLVKLPHLVDYLLNSDPKPSRQALMKYSIALASLYKKIDDEEDKAIVKGCILKIANALR